VAKLNQKEIKHAALHELDSAHGGIRWSVLVRAIHDQNPETPINSIWGATQALLHADPEIVKVARGIYQLAKYQDAQSVVAIAEDKAASDKPIQVETAEHGKVTVKESDFYESFALWLEDEAEEVNLAIPLGGSAMKGKWGTPDLLGVLRPRAQDILKFEPQIVSAEIKLDPNQPVVAFGQAVAYRLFSHKSYIVIPNTTSQDDLSRLKALCSIHRVGLVTFTLEKENPDYTVLVPPQQASPDMFYTNQMLRRLLEVTPKEFNKLFS
jgi:hypothetical protein